MTRQGTILLLATGLLIGGARMSSAKYEQEQMALEGQLQQRIENILSKTLPPNSYLISVKVEMEDKPKPASVRSTVEGGRNKDPFLNQSRFVLPGVPQKKEFTKQAEPAVNILADDALIKKISISILVSPEISQDQIRAVRDVINASIPFNPLRGDEMDIQASPLLDKDAAGPSSPATRIGRATGKGGGMWSAMGDRVMLPLVAFLGMVSVILLIFVAFLFGPVRAFLNRLLTVLPRVGEQAAYAVSNASPKPAAPGPHAGGGSIAALGGVNGSYANGHGNGADRPFRFVQEDQLSKLSILLRQMSVSQAALVVAYLPPEWASRVLNGLEPESQSSVMTELSRAQEVAPEMVKEVEQQVKSKLPYLVGGVDWIQSVYQLTQPQTQRVLLNALNQQVPDVADALRRKTFFFEDTFSLGAGALRMLVQELGYPVAALSLKDEKPEERDAVLRKLPAAMREIVQEELELSASDKAAMIDAKARLVTLARRLLAEGRINLPERK